MSVCCTLSITFDALIWKGEFSIHSDSTLLKSFWQTRSFTLTLHKDGTVIGTIDEDLVIWDLRQDIYLLFICYMKSQYSWSWSSLLASLVALWRIAFFVLSTWLLISSLTLTQSLPYFYTAMIRAWSCSTVQPRCKLDTVETVSTFDLAFLSRFLIDKLDTLETYLASSRARELSAN